ncbi:hypothetical protein OHA46_33790 (plasmid) [Streptomyces sp. NBC_00708]
MSTTTPTAFTEPDRPKNLLIRCITVGGSYVDVTGPGEYSNQNHYDCHGCGESSQLTEGDFLFTIRPAANSHAAACRAIPLK